MTEKSFLDGWTEVVSQQGDKRREERYERDKEILAENSQELRTLTRVLKKVKRFAPLSSEDYRDITSKLSKCVDILQTQINETRARIENYEHWRSER